MGKFLGIKKFIFITECLEIQNFCFIHSSDEVTEFINNINPKIIKILGTINYGEELKRNLLLNCKNIIFEQVNRDIINFEISFINTPIHFFDFYSASDQVVTFKWELIKIFIHQENIEDVKLLKTNNDNFLIISLDVIDSISCSGFREILSSNEISKQFDDFDFQYQFYTNWFVVPMEYSNKIFIQFNEYELKFLNQFRDISKLFKEKQMVLIVTRRNYPPPIPPGGG